MRRLLKALLLVGAVALLSCTRTAPLTLLAGTYSDGFYAYELDPATGAVLSEGNVPEAPGAFAKAAMPNPSYLTVNGGVVYAVSEMPDSTASVWAWRLGDGFQCLGVQPTGMPAGGEDPCYVSTNGRLLAVANYTGGTLGVYRMDEGGRIAPLDSLVFSHAGGPDPLRQAEPHVHCAIFTPDGKYLLFSEFSADEIGMLDVQPLSVRNYRTAATLMPDSGPRHLLFNREGNRLYVIGELSGDITVFDYEDGRFTLRQQVKADEVDARGAADLHFSPDGKYLYASLRLENDGIRIFRVGEDGTLESAGYQRTGKHPRHFNLSPDGRLVIVACRDENALEIYRRDPVTGLLEDTGRRISLPKPVYAGWI